MGMLSDLGIKLPDMIAGIGGGVVNAVIFKRTHPFGYIGSVVVGAVTANYLGAEVSGRIAVSAGASSFLVGMAGMVLCQSIISAVKKWRPRIGGGQNAQ